MASKATNGSNLKRGDRVIAMDSAGNRYPGHLDHMNPCGQFYVLPDSTRQPFYAFSSALTATGDRQPGFIGTVDDGLGIDGIERQQIYLRHMRKNT